MYGGAYADYAGFHARTGYSYGFGAIESGAYATLSGYGLSASYHTANGFDYGAREQVAGYKLNQTDQTVEVQLGWKTWTFDHANRNENMPIFPNRAAFEQFASDNLLEYGEYNEFQSQLHREGAGNEGNVKMWMARTKKTWWDIPAIEGVFGANGRGVRNFNGPSYNYGTNVVSHTFLDVLPSVLY